MKRLLPVAQTMGRRSLSSSNEKFVDCPTMSAALLALRQEFDKKSNDDNEFPLFSPKANEQVWQTVKLDDTRTAAVLVPVVNYQGKISLLYTRRSSHMPTHADEVSFPGGHFDIDLDETLEDTALREAKEELLGEEYPWENVEIIGRASSLPSIKGTPVTPIIGVFPAEISDNTFPGHSGEVDDVFCVGLQDLMEMETYDYSERFRSNIPEYPAGEKRKIWGLTAVVTRPLLHKLLKPVFHLQSKSKVKT